ncbi:MAG: DUF6273 domain-containing protein, partial [Saccharofermentanales bacterium]
LFNQIRGIEIIRQLKECAAALGSKIEQDDDLLMKRFGALTITAILSAISLASCSQPLVCQANTVDSATTEIGDYMILGSYDGAPVIWRCVDADSNGLLMLSDRILCLKPFDAAGTHVYRDGTLQNDPGGNRAMYGSNLWETSNIRAWLNSTASASYVAWPDGCPPVNNAVYSGFNDYADEKGFLAEGNFTVSELGAIKLVSQKTLLNSVDVEALSDSGSSLHLYSQGFDSVIQNFDTAYGHNVTDRMFLLDVMQVYKVWLNAPVLGAEYYIGRPTQNAVDRSEYKNECLAPGKNWHYWLRTPSSHPQRTSSVRYVFLGDSINGNSAFSGCIYGMGVRPAFYLNEESLEFLTGSGSCTDPYKMKGQSR